MAMNGERVTIALPPEMLASVRAAVSSGDYSSSSDVIRDALRDWSHKRRLRHDGLQTLSSMWREAREQGGDGLDPALVFDELERRYTAQAGTGGKTR